MLFFKDKRGGGGNLEYPSLKKCEAGKENRTLLNRSAAGCMTTLPFLRCLTIVNYRVTTYSLLSRQKAAGTFSACPRSFFHFSMYRLCRASRKQNRSMIKSFSRSRSIANLTVRGGRQDSRMISFCVRLTFRSSVRRTVLADGGKCLITSDSVMGCSITAKTIPHRISPKTFRT